MFTSKPIAGSIPAPCATFKRRQSLNEVCRKRLGTRFVLESFRQFRSNKRGEQRSWVRIPPFRKLNCSSGCDLVCHGMEEHRERPPTPSAHWPASLTGCGPFLRPVDSCPVV